MLCRRRVLNRLCHRTCPHLSLECDWLFAWMCLSLKTLGMSKMQLGMPGPAALRCTPAHLCARPRCGHWVASQAPFSFYR